MAKRDIRLAADLERTTLAKIASLFEDAGWKVRWKWDELSVEDEHLSMSIYPSHPDRSDSGNFLMSGAFGGDDETWTRTLERLAETLSAGELWWNVEWIDGDDSSNCGEITADSSE